MRVSIWTISNHIIEWVRFASKNTNEKNRITIKASVRVTKDLDQAIKALLQATRALLLVIKALVQAIMGIMDITTNTDIMEAMVMDIIDSYENLSVACTSNYYLVPLRLFSKARLEGLTIFFNKQIQKKCFLVIVRCFVLCELCSRMNLIFDYLSEIKYSAFEGFKHAGKK